MDLEQRHHYVLRVITDCADGWPSSYDDYYLEFANSEDFEKAQEIIEDLKEEYEQCDVYEDELLDVMEERLTQQLGADKFGWTCVYEDTIKF